MQLNFDARTNVRNAFSTPLGVFELPNAQQINPRIAGVILSREKSDEGVTRSNRGGWHSDNHFLNWPELQFAQLAETFRSAITHMVGFTSGVRRFNISLALEGWANVNRAGDINSGHIHPNNHWSGVYYVQVPDLEDDPLPHAGKIQLNDPRGPITMFRAPGLTDSLQIQPREGMILLFPSWLYHSVNPFRSDATRISIAFNGRIDHFEELNG